MDVRCTQGAEMHPFTAIVSGGHKESQPLPPPSTLPACTSKGPTPLVVKSWGGKRGHLTGIEGEVVDVRVDKVVPAGVEGDVELAGQVAQVGAALAVPGDHVVHGPTNSGGGGGGLIPVRQLSRHIHPQQQQQQQQTKSGWGQEQQEQRSVFGELPSVPRSPCLLSPLPGDGAGVDQLMRVDPGQRVAGDVANCTGTSWQLGSDATQW